MPSAQEILNDPNYTNANDATKQAIFDKHIATSSDYTNANNETKVAIRDRFGLKAGGPISNIVRTTTEGVLPGLGGLTGAVAGASAMTPLAEGALVAGGPAGPFIAGALELGGAGLGAYLGAKGVGAIQDKLHQLIAPEDYVNRQLQRQQNPITTGVGQIAGGVVGLSPKVAVDTTAKIINTAMKARAASAAAQAGVSAGTQLATTGKVDPFETGVAAVTGAVLPGTNVIGAPFAGAGRAIGETVAGAFRPSKPTTETKIPPAPPENATPEQKAEFLRRVNEVKTKAPLVETAIRNKSTGEIERMGPMHDQARKEETKDTHEEGFVDAFGVFHERQAAIDQAKRAGQLPEDFKPSDIPGERPGLHSTDLRDAGHKEFGVTETSFKLKGGSKGLIETEASPNAFSSIVRMEHGEPISLVAKNKAGEEIGRLTYMPKGGPIDVFVKESERRKGVATALYDALEVAGGKIPDADSGVVISDEARALRASRELKSTSSLDELSKTASTPVVEAAGKVDVRSIPNEEEFYKHAAEIQSKYGDEEAIKFFEDYQKDLNERSIPVPNNMKELDDVFHKSKTFETKDRSEMVTWYESAKQAGVTPEIAEQWFFMLEDLRKLPDEVTASGATDAKIKYWKSLIKEGKELPANARKVAASYDNFGREIAGTAEKKIKEWFDIIDKGRELPPEAAKWLQKGRDELVALVRKAKGMGLDVGEEFFTGQSRIRLFSEKEKPGWKETLKNFFDNNAPMGDKVAEQAEAAIERKVYQTSDGRVIELHRQPEDTRYKMPDGTYREVKKGTEVWEWKDGNKTLLTHSPDLNLKRGDKIKVSKLPGKLPEPPERTGSTKRVAEYEPTIIDGNVRNIEQHSGYKYWHDALASQALARMGLRKMVREAELLENLKQSELFKQIAHGPDQDPKTLPSHYVQPENIGLIPQLRGWAFDPKAAAIIDDFAKVWDNTMWMKATNALVKNMMLNPVPHMFNEVMHLWNARGFTGWVMPGRLGTFADTARQAWNDVGNQSKFYRDIMREGGSILGADPRNNKYFQAIQKEAQKQMFGTPEMERSMGQLAKKLGTTTLDLYNGISNVSQKAMWFTRDVMYVQYIREIMARQEKSTGVKMELKDAIEQAEKHMPNYRMPSEVLGSRAVAKILKNPNIDLFSRYHYGMVKSLVNTIKDVDPRNLKTPEGRAHFREGVDSMLAIGVAMGVLYPLMDYIAESMFGEEAEQRRAGPFHLLQAGLDVYEGKKDLSALIWPVFTFNPVLLSLGQLALNKKVFTGKEIYHPDDSLSDIAGDIGSYALKQVPQSSPILDATADEEGQSKLIARQLDIKAKTEKEKEREARAKKYQERTKKGRNTKRAKGTYNP
jgi:hypothetical protein